MYVDTRLERARKIEKSPSSVLSPRAPSVRSAGLRALLLHAAREARQLRCGQAVPRRQRAGEATAAEPCENC